MAGQHPKTSTKLIAAGGVVVLLVAVSIAIRFGGQPQQTSTVVESDSESELQMPDGYTEPVLRNGKAVPGTGSSRLVASEEATEQDGEKPPEMERKTRRKRNVKKNKKESKPDQHGIYRTEDGKIDLSKMPPMGG